MLFEPCGDLLKDYGAYCETLRVTEREEVYRAIHTRTVALPRTSTDEGDGANGRAESEEGRSSAAVPPSPKVKAGRRASRPAAKDAAGGRRKSSLKASAESASAAGAASSTTEPPAAPPVTDVTLTSIALHYPVFCLNQRDMTPLCRAVPHCPSLLSIELVGCGLSVQSYMKLVEAVYRSPRVVSVAVDFNVPFIEYGRQRRFTMGKEQVEAGFVLDPTLHPPSYSVAGLHEFLTGPLGHPELAVGFRASVSSALSQDQCFNASAATVPPPRGSVTTYSAASTGTPVNVDLVSMQPPRGSIAGKAGEMISQIFSPDAGHVSQISNADAAGAAGMDGSVPGLLGIAAVQCNALEDESAAAALYLYPTQYCGLDQLPTPLELQIQEEKEKKGKVDGKKVQQLQAQRDTLRAFDQQHRTPVPKSWDGLLLTGIHSLSLRGNHIDDATASRLAQVLTEHPQSRLVSLNLWGNDITDAGAAALARMLRLNNVLQVLDLGNNQLSDTGMLELVSVFLMHQLTSPEEVLAARKAYLTRRGATEEEQKAAGQSLVLADVPSYEDLYAHWWYTQQQSAHAANPAELSLSHPEMTSGMASPRFPMLGSGSYPTPPLRDTQSSPTAAGNPKRTTPVKNKASKSESVSGSAATATAAAAAFHMTMMSSSAARAANRHTTGFDKDCVRVRHIADNDPAVRVPGNTVLEVLNMEENRFTTVAGARAVVRLLRLREPSDTAEMLAMVEVRDPPGLNSGLTSPHASISATPDSSARRTPAAAHRSGATAGAASASGSPSASSGVIPATGPTAIHAPELHCAGLRLRTCGVRSHRASNRAAWAEMDAVQEELNAALAVWVASASPTA